MNNPKTIKDPEKREMYMAGQKFGEQKTLIEAWNGEDRRFLHNGEVYHEDDVWEAHELLANRDNYE